MNTSPKDPGLARATEGEFDEVDLIPVRTYWQMVRRRFVHNRPAVVALMTLAVLVTLAMVVPTLTGDQYQKTSLLKPYAAPELAAPLGYNGIGQNIFLRLMKGLQTSLYIGFAAVTIIFVIGVSVGSIAGYFGGWVDNLLMRLVDIVLSLPSLLLILMVVAFFGEGNVWVIVIAIGIAGWTTAARLVRASFLSLREVDFVQDDSA
jgi:ABC-type dipeptide/oligopeptide/nickel transport system permease subunit